AAVGLGDVDDGQIELRKDVLGHARDGKDAAADQRGAEDDNGDRMPQGKLNRVHGETRRGTPLTLALSPGREGGVRGLFTRNGRSRGKLGHFQRASVILTAGKPGGKLYE